MTHHSRREEQSHHPVFIDNSGWRRRLSRFLAVTVGCACVGYLMLIGMLVGGLWQPLGSQPPSTKGPLPASTKGPLPTSTTGPLPTAPDRPLAGKPSPGPGGARRVDAPRVPGSAERPGTRHSRTPPSSGAEAGAPRGGAER